jgi:hypothetical protein
MVIGQDNTAGIHLKPLSFWVRLRHPLISGRFHSSFFMRPGEVP